MIRSPRGSLQRIAGRLALVLAIACAVLSSPRAALARGVFRTVLVIDASSSMLSTDPREIRKIAAELYVDLARDGDQIAVTGFDGKVRESTGAFTTLAGPRERDAVKAAIRAVGKDGARTDFTAGLGEAKRLLDLAPDEPGDQEFVVFLTDGQCDPERAGPFAAGNAGEICKRKVTDELVPALEPARVYAIGFGGAAGQRAFFEEVAAKSGGGALVTTKADELPELFARTIARILGSRLTAGPTQERIPIAIEEGARSLDVVVVGAPSLTAALSDPKGAPVATGNAKPAEAYFVDSPSYRFYKVARPAAGTWSVAVGGGGRGGRYVALEGLDLELELVDLPEVVEVGKSARVRIRLGTSAGKSAPLDFLDRHELSVVSMVSPGDCKSAPRHPFPVKRGADGVWEGTQLAPVVGQMCFVATLVPGAGGVLTRAVDSPVVRMVPPLHLQAAPIDFGRVKQDASGKATLSFAGSEIGEPVEVEWKLVSARSGLALDPEEVQLDVDGKREVVLTLSVDRDAKPGPIADRLRIVPKKPKGYEDRAVEIDVTGTVVPLTFWERYGFWIEVGLGVLAFLLLVIGLVAPARFRKGSVLHYVDGRDRDLPRQGSYPLAAKAKAGFYRGARLLVGATGPVRAGGVVELRAGPGGAVMVRPLGGAKVREVPKPDESGFTVGEPRDVALKGGVFRAGVGARYEIDGSGLTFWYTLR